MKKRYVMSAVCFLCACQVTAAQAEGFALTQWGARGLALAGGMVGRADDPSAIAYNAAGITLLPGTHVMGGWGANVLDGTVALNMTNGTHTSTAIESDISSMPYAYLSRQLNDRFWLGLGLFSRFGLDHKFPDDWHARYELTNIEFQTLSFVPTVAMKVNDALSLSVGLEFMYASSTMGRQIPCLKNVGTFPSKADDIKMTLDGSDWGAGMHLGVHLRLSDKLSLGFSYKSAVSLNVDGTAGFSHETANMLADQGEVPHAIDTGVHGKMHLPDSLALGLTYRPLANLSIEVGSVFTHWSTYDSLNIEFESDFQSVEKKKWRNGWNFNASVEYEPRDWLSLRAGIWHETPVTNEAYADFMVPGHGRTGVSLGTGFQWENWSLDMAYAHVWMRGQDYSESALYEEIRGGNSRDLSVNIYSVAISYAF